MRLRVACDVILRVKIIWLAEMAYTHADLSTGHEGVGRSVHLYRASTTGGVPLSDPSDAGKKDEDDRMDLLLLTSMVIPFCRDKGFDPPFRCPFRCLFDDVWGIAPTLANGISRGEITPSGRKVEQIWPVVGDRQDHVIRRIRA